MVEGMILRIGKLTFGEVSLLSLEVKSSPNAPLPAITVANNTLNNLTLYAAGALAGLPLLYPLTRLF